MKYFYCINHSMCKIQKVSSEDITYYPHSFTHFFAKTSIGNMFVINDTAFETLEDAKAACLKKSKKSFRDAIVLLTQARYTLEKTTNDNYEIIE